MGSAKQRLEEETGRGFVSTGQEICPSCIGDSALGHVVRAVATQDLCSFCGNAGTAPLDDVLEHALEALRLEYLPASEESPPWDGREGADALC